MKTVASLLLTSAMILTLVGCGGNSPASTTGSGSAESPSNTSSKGPDKTTPAPTTTTNPDVPDQPQPTPPDWNEDGALRILTIGNSFSDDSMEYVYQIALSAGVKKVELGNLYIGGCTLDTHYANAKSDAAAYEYRTNTAGNWSTTPNTKMSTAIGSKKWDFISLQQASGSSGMPKTYRYLPQLIQYVRELCPDAVLVWNMTWAYQQDSTHNEFPNYKSDQTTMYNAILSAVQTAVADNPELSLVIPTGTAVQNARTSYVGDHLTRDGYHLTTDFGRYVAGLTFVHKLTGLPIDSVEFSPTGVDADLQKIAIESAQNAVKTPYGVTQSAYTKAATIETDGLVPLELGLTALGYWNSTDPVNHHVIITGASNSKDFYATAMFTRETLPVGSVIEIAAGWQYRPEGWKNDGVQGDRPGNVTTAKILVTEDWWGDYVTRAFNISKIGTPSLENLDTEARAAFKISVPKG